MSSTESQPEIELYRRAEKAISQSAQDLGKAATDLVGALLHRAHELEAQVEELNRTKTELQEFRERFANLYDFAPVGYFILDSEGVILSTNMTACEMLGQSREKLEKTSFFNLVAPTFHAAFRAYLQEIAQTGQLLSTEVQMSNMGGKVFYAHLQTVPMYEKSHITYRVSMADVSERKKAEEALRTSERRYSLLFENMLDGFAFHKMVYDDQHKPVDFVYLNVNSAFEAVTGLKNVVGRKVTEVIPGIKESSPDLFAAYSRVALTGIPERLEIELKSLVSWFDIAVYSTEKEHFVTIVDNITERKRLEQVLSASEQKYRELADSFPEIVFETDLAGALTYANRKAVELYNLTPEDLQGRLNIQDFVPPDSRDLVRERFVRVLSEGDIGTDEYLVRRKEGTFFPALVHTTRLTRDGKPGGVRGIAVDITERKRLEEGLQSSEKRLRNTLDSILEGCVILDFNWRCVFANEAVSEQGRFTKEQWVGHTIMELLPGFEKTEIYARQKETMEQRVPHDLENEYTYPDGTKRWFQINIRPVPEGILILYLNITEHKATEQRLKHGVQRLERIYGFTKLSGMHPIGLYMIEHRLIERVISVLAQQRDRMKHAAVNSELIEYLVDFFRTYADATHHGKEENVLFKALAAKPLSLEHREMMEELVSEHTMARRLVTNLIGARERWAAGEADARQQLITAADALIKLYPEHIEKEDRVFFPVAMKYFNLQEQDDMLLELWEFDRQMIHLKYTQGVDLLTQPSPGDIG